MVAFGRQRLGDGAGVLASRVSCGRSARSDQAGYCVAAGLGRFARWMTATRASPADVDAIGTHRSSTGEPLFEDDFCAIWQITSQVAAEAPRAGLDADSMIGDVVVDALDRGVHRLVNPHEYHVSITTAVRDEKRRLLEALR